jgi:hypothetical protein
VADARADRRRNETILIAGGIAMTDRIATTEPRPEGFYWVTLGQNPPEIAY